MVFHFYSYSSNILRRLVAQEVTHQIYLKKDYISLISRKLLFSAEKFPNILALNISQYLFTDFS